MLQPEQVSRRLKLRQLEVFVAVVQRGGMAKAAADLRITQPVISKTIVDLERTLGVQLLDRNSQGVEPTLFGRALLRRAVALFDDLRTSVGEIEFLADPTSGYLRIGTTEIMAAGFVASVIDQLSNAYPRIDFEVEQGDSATLINRLRDRRDELMIGRLPKSIRHEDLTITTLYYDRLRVVASLKSTWASRRKLKLSDLVEAPWCVPSPDTTATGSIFADAFRASGLAVPRIAVRVVSAQLTASLLAHGRYLTVLGESSFMHFNAQRLALKILPIELSIPPFPVAIVTLKDRMVSPVAQLFIKKAFEEVRLLRRETRGTRFSAD
jgi:DNA-binding transcriptional LysR family regulator